MGSGRRARKRCNSLGWNQRKRAGCDPPGEEQDEDNFSPDPKGTSLVETGAVNVRLPDISHQRAKQQEKLKVLRSDVKGAMMGKDKEMKEAPMESMGQVDAEKPKLRTDKGAVAPPRQQHDREIRLLKESKALLQEQIDRSRYQRASEQFRKTAAN
jgi:hypothetical protein